MAVGIIPAADVIMDIDGGITASHIGMPVGVIYIDVYMNIIPVRIWGEGSPGAEIRRVIAPVPR